MDSKYFDMDSKRSLSSFCVVPELFELNPLGNPVIKQLTYGEYPFDDNPIVYLKDYEGGNKLIDVLPVLYVYAYVISTRLRDVLIANNVTGWKSYDIVIRKKNGEEVPGYCGFSVTGRNPKAFGGKKEDDIPDIFKVSPNRRVVACKAFVKTIFKENGIIGMKFEELLEEDKIFLL